MDKSIILNIIIALAIYEWVIKIIIKSILGVIFHKEIESNRKTFTEKVETLNTHVDDVN